MLRSPTKSKCQGLTFVGEKALSKAARLGTSSALCGSKHHRGVEAWRWAFPWAEERWRTEENGQLSLRQK